MKCMANKKVIKLTMSYIFLINIFNVFKCHRKVYNHELIKKTKNKKKQYLACKQVSRCGLN